MAFTSAIQDIPPPPLRLSQKNTSQCLLSRKYPRRDTTSYQSHTSSNLLTTFISVALSSYTFPRPNNSLTYMSFYFNPCFSTNLFDPFSLQTSRSHYYLPTLAIADTLPQQNRGPLKVVQGVGFEFSLSNRRKLSFMDWGWNDGW